MSWIHNIFKKDPAAQTESTNKDGSAASVEVASPFFNVMPKAKVLTEVPEGAERAVGHEAVAQVPSMPPPTPLPTPVAKVASEPIPASPVIQSRVDKDAPPLTAKEQSVLSPFAAEVKKGQSKTVQVVGIIFVLVLALGAIGYTYATFGKNASIFQGVRNWFSALPPVAHKQANTSIAAPSEVKPQDTSSKTYNTAEDWRVKNFGSADCETCGDESDFDKDGLTNREEYESGTNPNNIDTDGDGLVDGDEVHVFGCLPVNAHSAGNAQYSDSDDLRGGWDCVAAPGTDVRLTPERIADIKNKVVQAGGLHSGTVVALGASAVQYQAAGTNVGVAEIKLPDGVSDAPEAKLDRDVQRLNTIRKVGDALLKYRAEQKTYPAVDTFAAMVAQVKTFVSVATNFEDPVNTPPLVYGYEYSPTNNSFALTYFSETQKQLIRYTEQQAADNVNSADKQVRDSQRIADLEKIRSALLIYSAASTSPSQSFVFPPQDQYQNKIAPQYIQVVPKDPLTEKDYEYSVSKDGSAFSVKAVFEKPSPGTTGYLCDQEDCKTY